MGYISDIRKKIGHAAIFMPCAGCAIIKNNKILLQKRADNEKWAIHGGGLELGETFEEALIRELKEELNIKPINLKFINIYSGDDMHFIYPNDDEVFGICAAFLAEDFDGDIHIDEDEVTEVKWFNLDELPGNIHNVDKKPIMDIINYYKSKR